MTFPTLSLAELFVLSLATWRLASLFANENGPADVFLRIRTRAGVVIDNSGRYATNGFAKGLICVWCQSLWFAFVLTISFIVEPRTLFLFLPFALSAIAAVLEETTNRLMGYN